MSSDKAAQSGDHSSSNTNSSSESGLHPTSQRPPRPIQTRPAPKPSPQRTLPLKNPQSSVDENCKSFSNSNPVATMNTISQPPPYGHQNLNQASSDSAPPPITSSSPEPGLQESDPSSTAVQDWARYLDVTFKNVREIREWAKAKGIATYGTKVVLTTRIGTEMIRRGMEAPALPNNIRLSDGRRRRLSGAMQRSAGKGETGTFGDEVVQGRDENGEGRRRMFTVHEFGRLCHCLADPEVR